MEVLRQFDSLVLEPWELQDFFTTLLAAVKFLHKDSDVNVRQKIGQMVLTSHPLDKSQSEARTSHKRSAFL